MPMQEQVLYEFEGFVLDPVRRNLSREGAPVALPPKALATLLVLVERHGQVVDKEELFQKVWPDTFITEATLTQNIFRLRKTLGEEAGDHRFIVTVPGRGYSFVADLRLRESAPAAPAEPPPPAPAPPEEPPPPSPAEDVQPSSAPEAAPVADAPVTEAPTVAPSRDRWRPGRWAFYGGAALLLIGLAAAFLLVLRDRRSTSQLPAGARTPRRSIAVIGFRNLSGRADTVWLSTALAEMFTVELGVGGKIHTIAGESVTRTKRDLGLTNPESLSTDTLALLRENLRCDTVLLGSYLALGKEVGGRVRVDLRLLDTASGETLSALTGTRTEGELFELVSELGRELRQKLGAGPASQVEVASTRAAFPSSRDAGRFYAEGLEHLRSLDTLAARDLLLEATRAEPEFPLAHAALARAWSTLGYDANAVEEAARALELSANLPREDRLLVEAAHAEARKEWAKEIDIYDSLWRFFPDNIEYGLRLAYAQVWAGRAQQALSTVASLHQLPEPQAGDPRIDLAEAEATGTLSDFARQDSAAARAAAKGRKLGARLLTARALHEQGHALRNLGRQQEALERIEEAERIYSVAGDQVGIARAIHDVANLLRDSGDFAGAREQYERALSIHSEAGNQRGRVLALTNLGGMEMQAGNYDKAQQLLGQAVEISREVHDPLSEGRGLLNLGSVLQERGNLQEAQRSLAEAQRRFRSIGNVQGEAGGRTSLAAVYLDLGKLREAKAELIHAIDLSRKIGHPRSLGLALHRLGLILIEEGRLAEAEAAFREMQELADKIGHKLVLADAEAGMAQVARFQGKLPEARQKAGAALALWKETNERQQSAVGQLALARIALDEGRIGDAEGQTNEALESFRILKLRDGEALGRETLAAVLLSRGQTAAAAREIRQATELVTSSQNRRVRLRIAVMAGRVAGALGRTAEARRALTAARDESAARGLRLVELDAELALAELALRQGDTAAGQRALQGVQTEAARQGLTLIAERAARLLQGIVTSPRRL